LMAYTSSVIPRLMQATASLNSKTGSFATTGSNQFNGNQGITGSLSVSSTLIISSTIVNDGAMALTNGSNLTIGTGSLFILSSSQFVSGSIFVNGREEITGSLNVSGSVNVIGNTVLSGSLFISGSTEFGGNIVPKESRGATLGTVDRPFADIFVSSGSINIASDVIGAPNTSISNVGGNLLVSAGGMRLLGSASFIAATGSFQFISGSMTQIGNYTQTGNYVMSGSKTISGNLNVNGSIYKDGNKQFNYGQWASLYTQTGSANTAYAMKLETQTDGLSGFYVGNNASGFPTRIYSQNTGLYNLQFSAQLHTTSNEACDFSVWFAMTGSNIAYSNTDFSIEKINGGGFQVAALNFLTPISSGSYVELYWSKTTANGQLQAKGVQSTPTRPATPSLIVTVTQVA
jgi:hypothetical protein